MIRTTVISIATALAGLLFSACAREEVDAVPHNNSIRLLNDSILLLRVDYSNNTFEGGTELVFSQRTTKLDSLPIKTVYEHPCDIGGIELLYAPANKPIFSGSIIWNGCGKQSYPTHTQPVEQFDLGSTAVSAPAASRIQPIYINKSVTPMYDDIWNAVAKLDIVADYNRAGNKVGFFLYTPSMGTMGNPNEWNWFIIMMK